MPVEFGSQPRGVGDNERRVGGRLRNRAELNQFGAPGLFPDLRDDVAQCDRLTRRNVDRPGYIALEQPHERIRYIFDEEVIAHLTAVRSAGGLACDQRPDDRGNQSVWMLMSPTLNTSSMTSTSGSR